MAIVGLGGTGKTQIALEFAYSVRKVEPDRSIFWLPAISLETFEQACIAILALLDTQQIDQPSKNPKELLKRLLSSHGKWLLIVDNADNIKLMLGNEGIDAYLPRHEDGQILFTTRYQEVAVVLAGSGIIEVEEMGEQEAFGFFEASMVHKQAVDKTDTETLLQELNYLPLAISQAAAYINKNKIPVAEYVRLLKGTDDDLVGLMSREFHDNTRYRSSSNAVATTWIISFQQMQAENPDAARLLEFMSCIEWKAIPRSLLPPLPTEEAMTNAIDREETYDMHRLVHLATKIWIQQEGLLQKIQVHALVHISKIFPFGGFENRELWQKYMSHTVYMFQSQKHDLYAQGKHFEALWKLPWKIGWCHHHDSRDMQAEAMLLLEEVVAVLTATSKKNDSRLLGSQYELASAYLDHGRAEQAVKLFRHVVDMREELPKNHPDNMDN
ncbi:hypothetical protein EJ04DRAFT_607410 [Polyplosphaeria fusca]|uniref:NB-ARC domain-containing protein n=1 Tax=Polyplosphaeria fusca TaxID=682080 RepID=A0A9P4V0Z2_9PLEO|nr:hypothetical protein EJ04DRAFT_607410 [Polyplosphaeria fusca]